MKLKLLTTAAAILALASTPVLAQANAAERMPAAVSESEEIGGENGIIIAILAAAAVIAGIIIIASDDDEPTSP